MNNPTLTPGVKLKNARYTVARHLKSGGFGAVYIAEDATFGRRSCVVKESFGQSQADIEQFEREAAILSTLSHPHLVRVTDSFREPNAGQYMVMEYIDGEDLEEMLARTPGGLSEAQVSLWADQVLDALSYCHTFTPPVIHRDIKPSNIRIRRSDGRAVLVDFGIAKIGDPKIPTQQGARGVSPLYSPFEQYSRGGTGPYSDVYALGATLYHLLTGVEPPEAPDVNAGVATLPPPRSLRPMISPQTERVILTAMQNKVQDRYQTADEMRRDLKGMLPTALCPHCGAATRMAARFCPNCSLALMVQPLVFPTTTTQATTIAELARGCEQHWRVACDLLRKGEIEVWLGALHATALQQEAARIRVRRAADINIALEEFLEAAAPNRSKGILSVQPTPLDFGRARRGDDKTLALTVVNSGAGYLHGQVNADPLAWLSIQPSVFGCTAGGQQVIQATVKTAGLTGDAAGVIHNGRIIVQSNRGQQTVDVRVAVMESVDLRVSVASLDFGTTAHGIPAHRSFEVSNAGGGVLRASVQCDQSWVVLVDAGGNPLRPLPVVLPPLVAKQATTVHVMVESGQLAQAGSHSGLLRIDGAAAPVATLPVRVQVDPPYRLEPADPASAISTPEQLWRWCDGHWLAALRLLAAGRLEACLAFLGKPPLARAAAQASRVGDANLGLEGLLRACGAPPARQMAHNAGHVQASLGFSLLPKSANVTGPVRLRIVNQSGRGYLHGHVAPLASWLTIPQPNFGCLPGQPAEIELAADFARRPRWSLRFSHELFEIVVE